VTRDLQYFNKSTRNTWFKDGAQSRILVTNIDAFHGRFEAEASISLASGASCARSLAFNKVLQFFSRHPRRHRHRYVHAGSRLTAAILAESHSGIHEANFPAYGDLSSPTSCILLAALFPIALFFPGQFFGLSSSPLQGRRGLEQCIRFLGGRSSVTTCT
jgi:hypothetical protein